MRSHFLSCVFLCAGEPDRSLTLAQLIVYPVKLSNPADALASEARLLPFGDRRDLTSLRQIRNNGVHALEIAHAGIASVRRVCLCRRAEGLPEWRVVADGFGSLRRGEISGVALPGVSVADG